VLSGLMLRAREGCLVWSAVWVRRIFFAGGSGLLLFLVHSEEREYIGETPDVKSILLTLGVSKGGDPG